MTNGLMQDPREMGAWDLIKARYAKRAGLTDLYQQQQGRQRAAELVGARQQPYQMGEAELFPGETQAEAIQSGLPVGTPTEQQISAPQGLMTKGAGLLGGEVTPAEFYGGLMTTPGYQATGAQGLQNIAAQQGLMARQLAKQKPMIGQFKDMPDYLKARRELRKEWQPQLAPSRESIRKFNQATDIITKRKGFVDMTGADDTVLIKAFASMILPGEAVMEGDIATIVNQSGLPGTLQSYLQAFKGEGQLGLTQRQEIYDAMTGLAERANRENIDIRAQMEPDISMGQIDPRGLFRSPLQYKPYTPKASPPPPGFK